jgi:hypothetical protein
VRQKQADDAATRNGSTARSLRELAALVGRSHSVVRRWLARADWPFSPSPPWDASEVLAWAGRTLAADPAKHWESPLPADPGQPGDARVNALMQQAKAQVFANRALLLRQEYEKRAGKLHDSVACEQMMIRRIHALKQSLLDVPRMGSGLEGLGGSAIEQALMERIVGILKLFAGEA